jgi:hypothetical protein
MIHKKPEAGRRSKAAGLIGRPEKQSGMSLEERQALALLPDELAIYRGSNDYNEWPSVGKQGEW